MNTDVSSQNYQLFKQKKSVKINNKNTNCSIDITRNNFLSQNRFSVFNCDEVNNNVLDDEINIFNVLKTKHTNAARLIQNVLQNLHWPPVVVNNCPENQHDFRTLNTIPWEKACTAM